MSRMHGNAEDADRNVPPVNRVLIVDDDEGLNRLLQRSLRRYGYGVEGVFTGADAIERVMGDAGLTLLLDLKLPDISGTDIIRKLIERQRPVPFVAMTGHGDEKIAVEMMKLGARDYLVKGTDLLDLLPNVFRRLFRELETERQLAAAEQALRESEEKYRNLVQGLPDLILIYDAEGTHIACQSSEPEMLLLPPERFLGRTAREVLPPDLADWLMADIARVLDGEMVPPGEYSLPIAGEKRYFERRLVRYGQDQVMIIIRDITDQMQAEERLRFQAHLLDAVEQAVVVTDTEGHVVYWNPFAEKLYGWSAEEAMGHTTLELMADDQSRQHGVEILARLQSGRRWSGEYEARHRNGTIFPIHSTCTPIFDERGNITHIIGISEDITERIQAEAEKGRLEQQFHQAQKLESVGRLAGGVAHDLNNLLSPILGYGEMLLDETPEPDPRIELLEEIVSAGRRARDLVRQLLAFSRKQTLKFRFIDLNILLQNFEKLLRRTIREDVFIYLRPAPSLPPVKGDAGQLEQVIMNLAVNARDAMPDGGELTIETAQVELDESYTAQHEGARPGLYVMLSASDTGHGMDAETKKHIFEPFFTTKEVSKGTGLGLATVYGIVKQHGGNIWVYSEPGHGATFKVYLPVTSESPHAETEEEDRHTPSGFRGSETILLVEDNDQVRNLTLAILKREGYKVISAANGREALEELDRHEAPVHLLLSDVVMPGMNGRQLFEQLSGRYPDMRVLYMSGYTDDVIAQRGIMEPGVHFIQKPFSIKVLAARVREVLEN